MALHKTFGTYLLAISARNNISARLRIVTIQNWYFITEYGVLAFIMTTIVIIGILLQNVPSANQLLPPPLLFCYMHTGRSKAIDSCDGCHMTFE
jgi:hypothetical protein